MSGVSVLLNNAGADTGVPIVGEWKTWNGGAGDFWVWGGGCCFYIKEFT